MSEQISRVLHNGPAMTNDTCQKLFEILTDGLADEICIGAEELASSVDLDEGQVLTWLASATMDGTMVHVFFCEADGEDEQFINTLHGDGGQLIGFTGPFNSYAQAKRDAGLAEAWSEA
jgi:hypothetical protein